MIPILVLPGLQAIGMPAQTDTANSTPAPEIEAEDGFALRGVDR